MSVKIDYSHGRLAGASVGVSMHDHTWALPLEGRPGIYECTRCGWLVERSEAGEFRFSPDDHHWQTELPECDRSTKRHVARQAEAGEVVPLPRGEVWAILERYARQSVGGGSQLNRMGISGKASTATVTHCLTVASKLQRCPHVQRMLWISEATVWVRKELQPLDARGSAYLADLTLVLEEVRDVLFEHGVGVRSSQCTGSRRTCDCITCEMDRTRRQVSSAAVLLRLGEDDRQVVEDNGYAWEMLYLGCEFAAAYRQDPHFHAWVHHLDLH